MTQELTESEAKAQGEPPKSARYWHNQIDASLKREDKWRKRADAVVCRYMDERERDEGDVERRINILWSNTEVLKSVLFDELGSPDVRRTFPQPGKLNKIARTSALVLERALVACANRYDVAGEVEDSVTDYLLAGRGQGWIEYDAEIIEQDGQQSVGYQEVKICHVPWDDWTHGPGKKWQQVPWVARMHLFTRDDFKAQFPEIDLDRQKVPFNFTLKEGEKRTDEDGAGDFKRAKLWEIWDKVSRTRIYVADGYDWEIERIEDPYRLEGFFPCPKPLYGVKTPDRLIPQPEYCQYQDQAAELDRINQRIYVLVEDLKYCGVYDGSAEEDTLSGLGRLSDGQFLPYKNFAALSQGGGLAAAFQVRDLAPIAAAIQQLAQRAISLIQSIYEITGISDVIRGATDPNETLGAQQLKARFGSQRMQKRQKEVQTFVRDLYKMKAEIIAEHFSREQLQQMTGILLPSEAERAQAQQRLAMTEKMKQMQQMQAQQPGPPANMPPGGPGMQPGMPPMPMPPPTAPMGHNGGSPMDQGQEMVA